GGVETPFAVRARRQTRGRGRGTNTWWSDGGSLTVTLALDPSALGLRREHEPRLALAAAVAIIDAVSPLLSDPGSLGIRWRDDGESGGRKVAGLLPERVESPPGPGLLIGIGLNARTRLDDAPPGVRAMAVSLHELAPEPLEPPNEDAVLRALLDHLAGALDRLAGDDPALAGRWAALDTLLGRPVRVDLGAPPPTGAGRGTAPERALLP